MTKEILSLASVTVRKHSARLLSKINLQILKNEFVGLIGPNGAGKTTLLNVIAGFEKYSGDLSLFGQKETTRRSRHTRLRVGYVPQLFPVEPNFPISAKEAVLTGAAGRLGLFCNPGKKEEQKALALMEIMRISQLANRPLGQLSGGERQKVSLARAIFQQPDLLLLDEPTAGLDIAMQKEVYNLIDEISEQQALTILLVTHDFNLLPLRMKRMAMLRRGEKIFDGSVQEALASKMLSDLFQYPLEAFEQNGKRFISYG